MDSAILKGTDLVRDYGRTKVLDHVNLEVRKGEFLAVMGPSGAGKSTLLYALSGMDPADAGEVILDGERLAGADDRKLARLRASRMGFIFQAPELVSSMTVRENVELAGYLSQKASPDEIRRRTAVLMDELGIANVADHYPSQLSGGEAARASVCRAVVGEPSVIFADEPTGALNRNNTDAVLDILTELNRKGQTILVVTHDIRVAFHAERIIYFLDGKIRDELVPGKYERVDKNRESLVNTWLNALEW